MRRNPVLDLLRDGELLDKGFGLPLISKLDQLTSDTKKWIPELVCGGRHGRGSVSQSGSEDHGLNI
jgi:hypothetical protein